MVANTWIAAAPGDWSDDANWSLGHSPIAGEDPTFDGTSVNNCNANDDTPTGVLTIAAGYTGTITQSSDMYISGYSQAGGTFTGALSKWMYLNDGSFSQTAGTLTGDNLNLNLINSSLIQNIGIFAHLKLSGDSVISSSISNKFSRLFTNEGNLVITTEWNVGLTASPYTVNNMGYITGTLIIWGYGNDVIINPGIGTDTRIAARSSASKNLIFTINGDVEGITNIYSAHATYTCTLDLNGHDLIASSITVGTRGILTNSATTVSVIKCASLDSSAGTFTPDRTVLVMEGASTIKLAAGGTVNNMISKGVTTLASDVTISNVCAHVNPITKGAFALTLTKPENEYTGLRRPMIIPVKNLDIGPVGPADGWLRDLGAVV